MSPAQTPSERSLIASIAAHASWGHTVNRAARTEAARKAMEDRFERLVPAEIIDPTARLAAADNLRKAFYKSLARKSAIARKAKGTLG